MQIVYLTIHSNDFKKSPYLLSECTSNRVHSSKAKRKQACMDLYPVMIIHYISIGFSTTLQLSVKEQFFELGLSIRALDSSCRWKGLLHTFQCKLTEIPLIFYSYLMQSKINIITLRNWSPNNTSSRFLHF